MSLKTNQFWRNENHKEYLSTELNKRSRFLVELLGRYPNIELTHSILEIGCSSGRNLNHLYRAGYKNLTGIDVSKQAIKMIEIPIITIAKPIEKVIKELEPYDVVITMSTLEALPPDSMWILEEIARITKRFLITIEGGRHTIFDKYQELVTPERINYYGRDYKEVFESLGLEQIAFLTSLKAFNKYTFIRVFMNPRNFVYVSNHSKFLP